MLKLIKNYTLRYKKNKIMLNGNNSLKKLLLINLKAIIILFILLMILTNPRSLIKRNEFLYILLIYKNI